VVYSSKCEGERLPAKPKGNIMKKNQKARVAHANMTVEKVLAVQELRRSGASGGHDSRPRRQRTRASAKAAALRDA